MNGTSVKAARRAVLLTLDRVAAKLTLAQYADLLGELAEDFDARHAAAELDAKEAEANEG